MVERPDLFVTGRLLEALAPGPLLRTQLQQKAGFNYTVFQRYLELLLYLGLAIMSAENDGRLEPTAKRVNVCRFLLERITCVFGLEIRPIIREVLDPAAEAKRDVRSIARRKGLAPARRLTSRYGPDEELPPDFAAGTFGAD